MQRLGFIKSFLRNYKFKTANDGEMCYALVKIYQTQNRLKMMPFSVLSEENFRKFSTYKKNNATNSLNMNKTKLPSKLTKRDIIFHKAENSKQTQHE